MKNNSQIKTEFHLLHNQEKSKSLNLEKEQAYVGKLKGIKGQYLIFEDDTVLNIRGSEGLVVSVEIK